MSVLSQTMMLCGFALLQNSVLAIPKAQWHEREFKPFGINGNVDLPVLTKVMVELNSANLWMNFWLIFIC